MISRSAEETRAAGRRVAARVRPGDRVLLTGPLGSGKTTFVQGVAEGLGATVLATSPSFVVVHEYAIGSRKPSLLRHIDLYRLPDPAVDVDRVGLPELFSDREAITVIEWAEKLPTGLLATLLSASKSETQSAKAGAAGVGGPDAGRSIRVQFEYGEQEGVRIIHVSGD